ncbi:MAG: hypothetical protein UW30_C0003G0003 [Candidatus Giovannonibacteria bacterium GW2011_GWA2_44_13b]|uniref:DUF7718 domain-containing protein n=1 Tax=Candidatus Giovannonibacteria bacterium GW2011_GWA2_44_13b TaxID=1618647 RepID=A0A0G1H5W1_9BACT|nr:MAG: hypothetical protein UW30_C0003G0003 [Candidatus Giovannonibacteria bacterium GW2011_GWA2_44_13b]
MTDEDKVCADFRMIGGKIASFGIHFMSKIDGKWKDIIRIDTTKHGDLNKEGLAHVHHFYKHKKAWYQLLRGKYDNNFDLLYKQWLDDIIKRAKYYKHHYLYDK